MFFSEKVILENENMLDKILRSRTKRLTRSNASYSVLMAMKQCLPLETFDIGKYCGKEALASKHVDAPTIFLETGI